MSLAVVVVGQGIIAVFGLESMGDDQKTSVMEFCLPSQKADRNS